MSLTSSLLRYWALCCPIVGGPRLDRWVRIHLGQAHFGVFSTSRFVPPALSLDWRGVTTDLRAGISNNVTHAGSQLTLAQDKQKCH